MKKKTFSLKNYVASLFTFFWKSLSNLQIFYRLVFRCKVLRPFIFYLFEVQTQYWYLLLCREKMCWSSSYFYQGEETFAVSLQNHKSCVCIKYEQIKLRVVCFFFLKKKKIFTSKSVCHVYVYAMALTWTYHQRVCVFVDQFIVQDRFGFFLNEDPLNSLRNDILAQMTPFRSN